MRTPRRAFRRLREQFERKWLESIKLSSNAAPVAAPATGRACRKRWSQWIDRDPRLAENSRGWVLWKTKAACGDLTSICSSFFDPPIASATSAVSAPRNAELGILTST